MDGQRQAQGGGKMWGMGCVRAVPMHGETSGQAETACKRGCAAQQGQGVGGHPGGRNCAEHRHRRPCAWLQRDHGPPGGQHAPQHAQHRRLPQSTRQCHGQRYEKEDALGILITAYKPIPSSVSKKKLRLMLDRLIFPGKKPDWDNIGKIICDALNGIVWKDDAQIVDGRVVKLYAEHPRVEVEIWRVGQNG